MLGQKGEVGWEKENIENRTKAAFETDGERGNYDISFLGLTEAVNPSQMFSSRRWLCEKP